LLQVQLDDGNMLQYSGVGEEAWRRLSNSGSTWSYYRDNIEKSSPRSAFPPMPLLARIRSTIYSANSDSAA